MRRYNLMCENLITKETRTVAKNMTKKELIAFRKKITKLKENDHLYITKV